MISDVDFEQGMKELEALLNREISATQNIRDEAIQKDYEEVLAGQISLTPEQLATFTPEDSEKRLKELDRLLYFRIDQPSVIGRGTNQLALDVQNGLIAKIGVSSIGRVVEVGRGLYQHMQETVTTLRELGFEVPEVRYARVRWEGNRVSVNPDVEHGLYGEMSRGGETRKLVKRPYNLPNVTFTVDLRENGRYDVVEFDPKVATKLPNSVSLVEQFAESSDKLVKLYDGYYPALLASVESGEQLAPGPFLHYSPHREGGEAKDAVRKMFFLQVPTTDGEKGKLVIGDIDHVYVFK
ncbi:MAG: hypothetical protein KKA62_03315 [Nanoarchaeota archaeon]|nr:hypothetical protein [Nanoarchaeota archaeon]